jgi:hypothetical protein
VLFRAYTSFTPFANTHASYHIGSYSIGLENASSFDEANFSSLDHGKHRAFPLNRILLYNLYIMSMIAHISTRV